jgi:hypothetical protein
MKSKITKSKILNFVTSTDFDNYILDYIISEKKKTVKEYLSNKVIQWDDNDARFTVHDMNRAKIQYLDQLVQKMISDAQTIASETYTDEWDNKQYQHLHSILQEKSQKLKDFL